MLVSHVHIATESGTNTFHISPGPSEVTTVTPNLIVFGRDLSIFDHLDLIAALHLLFMNKTGLSISSRGKRTPTLLSEIP